RSLCSNGCRPKPFGGCSC
uniref:U1-poneritoxin-Ae1d n=1 Tax=Anochetus emarginatus TaxID=486636 RepID=PON1D_ANOEM|nr:RecName: Full=U1-poneritoxin-Ae1d; Short=U1-PONTX-Ae1d; AltName: Full=Poneratoxin [Anochetus emarginatus]